MSLTNLCSCALIKDHKMSRSLPTILNNYEFGLILLKNKYFDLFLFKNLILYPLPPPPPACNIFHFYVPEGVLNTFIYVIILHHFMPTGLDFVP